MIPISKPWLDDEELEALKRPLSSRWVAKGPEVEAFEGELAEVIGASHVCATSSGTTALDLALMAVGVEAGDEVITVSHSFIATANAVRHLGAIPVFVDIDPATLTMDKRLVSRVITSKTRAILCAHQLGMPCDVVELLEVADKHGLPLVEDAACALGSEVRIGGRWEKIGAPHGRVACFSFHPRKLLTTGEGGAISTSDAELDARCRSMGQHGLSPRARSYEILGNNFRMSDLQAAVGRAQLRKLDAMLERRRYLAARYGELLAEIDGVIPPEQPKWARTNWQSYCLRLPDGVDQTSVIAQMASQGVSALGGVLCAHREPVYQQEPWSCGKDRDECGCSAGSCERLRQSEEAQDRCLLLPMYHELTDDEQVHVVKALARATLNNTAS